MPRRRDPLTGKRPREAKVPVRRYPELGVGELVGARMRAARLDLHLSQAEVARRTGMGRPNIARLEQGRHHIPTLDTVLRIAWALGLPPSDFLACLDSAFTKVRDE